MEILLIKTGAEKYANRVYTSTFFLMPARKGDETILLTDHPTYMPHEEIICGINGCFGQWNIGHVSLNSGTRIMGVFTKKILTYDPHDSRAMHTMIHATFVIPGKKKRRYTQNYWGYNGGKEMCELLSGKFDMVREDREVYKLGVPLDKLPF